MTKKTNKNEQIEAVEAAVATIDQTTHDLVISILIVSLLVNLVVLIGWIAIKVTTAYDAEVAAFLFTH